MKKYSALIGLIILFVCNYANAQTNSPSGSQLRQLLNMTEAQYELFSDSLSSYSARQAIIQSDSTKSNAEQNAQLVILWSSRRAFLQQSLTTEQRSAFANYERQQSGLSPAKRLLAEQEARMKQKGLQVTSN